MEPYEKDVKLKTKQNQNPISLTNSAKCNVCLNVHGMALEMVYNMQQTIAVEPHNDFYDGIKIRANKYSSKIRSFI